jgi:hypothetical protein
MGLKGALIKMVNSNLNITDNSGGCDELKEHLHQPIQKLKVRSSLRSKIRMKRSLKLLNRELAISKYTPRMSNKLLDATEKGNC